MDQVGQISVGRHEGEGTEEAVVMTDSLSNAAPAIRFDNTYARLPGQFGARTPPSPASSSAGSPAWVCFNRDLAKVLGLDADRLAGDEGLAIFSGAMVAPGSEPLAMAYAGHQFGYFVPQLGDGRANLLGEVVAPDGRRFDIQLKGSGRTPFSRAGDGRAALGPVLREYLVSEAMAAMGVPTTRALAAVRTGDSVYRETVLPGAVLTRVADSHMRVGTFQFFAARGDVDSLRTLASYAIDRHYPEIAQGRSRFLAFLQAVIQRQAGLVAHWMSVGFVHGVMNTDNMSISGETIDYGPCAFMEAYNPETVFSSIDAAGRYAYGNQPRAASWNLARLAEALLPLLIEEAGDGDAAVASANQALEGFATLFEDAHLAHMRAKLGLSVAKEDDAAIVETLLDLMTESEVDFTRCFRLLSAFAVDATAEGQLRDLFGSGTGFHTWLKRWQQRAATEPQTAAERSAAMLRRNPAYIPRNHLVEEMIAAAVERKDLVPFRELLRRVTNPFEEQKGSESYLLPATEKERVLRTFCGT